MTRTTKAGKRVNNASYYVTYNAGRWQVRTGSYPSATIAHEAASAVDAHIWAEHHGYELDPH